MSVTKQDQQLDQDFQRLTAMWKRETKHLSRIDQVCAHPSRRPWKELRKLLRATPKRNTE